MLIISKSEDCFGQFKTYQDSINFYNKKKDFKKSLIYYDKIIKLYPNSAYYTIEKGIFLHDLRSYAEAVAEFSRALKINSNIVDAYVRRGRSYLGLHLYDSSINDFNLAYGKLKYQDSVIFLYRGHAYLKKGNYDAANADYDSASKFNSSYKEFLKSRALVKIEMEDLESALNDLNRVVIIDSSDLIAIKNRAIVNFQLNNLDTSLSDVNTYLKKYPKDAEVNLIAGGIFFEMKDYKTALQYLNSCKDKIKTMEAYRASGLTNYYLVNDQQAINDLKIALSLSPTQAEEAELYYIIGVCKNNLNPKSGCNELSKAIEKGLADAKRTYSEDCK